MKNSSILYIGIDPSSTNTGVFVSSFDNKYQKHYLISPNKSKDFDSRVLEILKNLEKIFKAYRGFDLKIAIEAPSFMSKGKTSHLSMLCGAIYYFLLAKDIEVVLVPPSRLKKFATKNGRADKEEMYSAAPTEIKNEVSKYYKKYDDVIDAYFLSEIIK